MAIRTQAEITAIVRNAAELPSEQLASTYHYFAELGGKEDDPTRWADYIRLLELFDAIGELKFPGWHEIRRAD